MKISRLIILPILSGCGFILTGILPSRWESDFQLRTETGWKYVEAKPPSDLKVYPLKIDRIYVELNENKNDYGVILIDELEANYPLNQGQSASEDKNTFIFYVVEKGDTLDKICDKTHSNRNRKNDILKYNEISGDQDLIPGKILVLPVQDGR